MNVLRVVLFDYGVGNIHSLAKALEAGGARVRVEADAARALDGDALVLPGVGAFAPAAKRLATDAYPLRSALRDGFPCLGVCLGMQLLFGRSEEGTGSGLSVFDGGVRRLRARRVPHMGWNAVVPRSASASGSDSGSGSGSGLGSGSGSASVPRAGGGSSAPSAGAAVDGLFAEVEPSTAFYYANSFVVEPARASDVIAWTEYEGERFPAAVRRARTWGVQFHPEKSGRAGLRLIGNFLEHARGRT